MFDMLLMRMEPLQGLDLNLLPPLAAPPEERHVTRAPDPASFMATPSPAFRHEHLFEVAGVCVMSADLPLANRKRLTLDQYLDCSRLVIDIIYGDRPRLAMRLAELGVARRASVPPYRCS